MTRAVQQVLTALLLLIFSSEHVALSSLFQPEVEIYARHESRLVQHEIQVLGNFLAEQNEERDWRDDAILPVRRDDEAVRLMSRHTLDALGEGNYHQATLQDVPKYTYYCTYLI
ncbi:MAG: hypothetical protein JNL40_10435 [Cyclobacteriaceae bacterium]|nr:hypothetical protein [Cyclobacteriaceae bacterium]